MGERVTWVSSTLIPAPAGSMLFDLPSTDLASGEIMSVDYEVTFETVAWPGLRRADQLSIGGTGGERIYKLRTDPQRDADGVFSHVKLSKV